jgi:hypothetical protein
MPFNENIDSSNRDEDIKKITERQKGKSYSLEERNNKGLDFKSISNDIKNNMDNYCDEFYNII